MRKNHSIIWLKEAIEKKEKYIFKLHHFHIITIKMSFCHLQPRWSASSLDGSNIPSDKKEIRMRTHESNEACMGYSSFS